MHAFNFGDHTAAQSDPKPETLYLSLPIRGEYETPLREVPKLARRALGFLWLGTSAFGLRVQTFQFIGLQALGSRAFGLPDNIARVIGLISAGDMIARYLQTSRGCINARSIHSCACLSRKDPVTSAASAAVTSDQVNTAKMLAIGTAAEVGDGEEASRGGA